MRLRIAATITYAYPGEASHAHLQARLAPAATARQIVLVHPLSTEPTGWQLAHDDYWGTRVVELEVSDPHERFALSLISDVNLTGLGVKEPADDFTRLDAPGVEDSFTEFLRPTPLTTLDEDDAEEARATRSASDTPAELVTKLTRQFADGRVGDDATHVVIAALRATGVPARFVSGYRAPLGEFEPGTSASGEVTSWLDHWDGAWQGWDPSVAQPVSDRHVIIGWGRDRSDAPPLRGIYGGPDGAECHVEVQVTRLA